MRDDLQMTPEAMLDLARRTAELVVERTGKLPEENAWDGEFRQILKDQLMESPPEDGRPAMEVIEQAARDILPFTTRLDHPRCFGFIPSSPTWPACSGKTLHSSHQRHSRGSFRSGSALSTTIRVGTMYARHWRRSNSSGPRPYHKGRGDIITTRGV